MPTNYRKRVPPDVLDADRQNLVTLQSLTDYTPLNAGYSLATLQQIATDLAKSEEAETMARRAHELAREQATAQGIAFHEAMLAAKAQVVAQYGHDSPALHAIGRKQRSERRRPTRREASAR